MESKNQCQLSKEDFLELLKQANENEKDVREAKGSTFATNTGILTATVGGALAGVRLLISNSTIDGAFSMICGLIIMALSYASYCQYRSNFLRQVEYMTIQAKIEDILGLTDAKKYHAKNYWIDEPIIPASYISFRKKYKNNTNSFISNIMKTNDLSVMKWFFGVYGFIGVLLFAVGILMLFQIFPNIMSALITPEVVDESSVLSCVGLYQSILSYSA